MKERIERKLGCTIKEAFEKDAEAMKPYVNFEVEHVNFLDSLDVEELDYIEEHIDEILISK